MSTASIAATPRLATRATELALIGMAAIWGINFSVVKYGTQVMEPLAYNALRMSLAAVVLLVVAYVRTGRRADAADRRRLLMLGVLGHCVYQVMFIQGITLTRAGTASLVVAAAPALVALVARAYGHEKLPLRAMAGIALSIAGVLLVLSGTISADGTAHLAGDLMILAAVVAWAFYTVLLLPITRRADAVQIAAWSLVGGVIPLILVAMPSLWRTEWAAIAPLTWGAIMYSGLFAMVIAYLIWYRGVEQLGPTRTAMFGNLQPIVAVLVAWFMLGEVPTLFQGAGAATVIGGLYLARR
ncbi:MAG TPA: DMT family transporter [Gemmatimonadaceae bacterium]|nr:DMT family transporter [Gemmatimonadaceae bacterium]